MSASPIVIGDHELVYVDGVWHMRGPNAPDYPFFDHERALRETQRCDNEHNQQGLFS